MLLSYKGYYRLNIGTVMHSLIVVTLMSVFCVLCVCDHSNMFVHAGILYSCEHAQRQCKGAALLGD